MFAALLLQGSLLVAPLQRGDAPPETRALAVVRFANETSDAALAAADGFVKQLATPTDFESAAREHAASPTRELRGLFGTFSRAQLPAGFDEAWDAPQQAPIAAVKSGDGWLLAQRIERDAACRQIFIAGTGEAARARAEAIARELRAGADFQALARERSDDKASALRGGDLAIYERGPRDALLREAAFGAKVGEIVGPLATPLGFHLLQRVGVDALDARMRDDVWAHARAILVQFGGALGADPTLVREHDEAERIANDLASRIRCGEDMATLAAQFDDDRGGRERSGDLGWVRRATTAMPPFFDKLFTEPPGDLLGPIPSTAGFVLLRREDPGLRSRIVLRTSAFLEFERWVEELAQDFGQRALRPDDELRTIGTLQSVTSLHTELALPLDPLVVRSANATEFAEMCAALPEHWTGPRGGECALRLVATEFAQALLPLEDRFMRDVWPERSRVLDACEGELRTKLRALGDTALDAALSDLGLVDPRVRIDIYLVTSDVNSSLFMQSKGETAGIVSIRRPFDPSVPGACAHALRAVMHTSLVAVEQSARGSGGVLRALLDGRIVDSSHAVDAANLVLQAEYSWILDHVFALDVSNVLVLDATNIEVVELGGETLARRGHELEVTSSSVLDIWAAVVWNDHLAGKLTREQALDAIVALYAATSPAAAHPLQHR